MTGIPAAPSTCPNCQSTDVAEFLYGMPAFSEDLGRQIDAGEIRLAGCMIWPEAPKFECNACGTRFGQLEWMSAE